MNVLYICCDEMASAFEPGSDNEAYGALASVEDDGRIYIGTIQASLNYCPWCGEDL